MRRLRRVAVVTSGGDAPGMNAAIRTVARTASAQGIHTLGVPSGYAGLVEGRFQPRFAPAEGKQSPVSGL